MNFCCLLRISQKERRTFEIKVQQGPSIPIWNRIFVISCVFAVFLDPLFFYVVIINQDNQVPSNGQNPLRKGDVYGEELLDWAPGSFTELPVSSKHAKCQIKVEAFVLTANDLDIVVSKYRLQWKKSKKKGSPEVKDMAASIMATTYCHRRRRLRAINNVH
ncbi:hypothetical protein ACFX2J_002164 [Malus domestica]